PEKSRPGGRTSPATGRGVRPRSTWKEPLVQGLFSHQAFGGFGPARLALPGGPLPLTRVQGRPSRLRHKVRLECPRRPGVYGMVDRAGELIYVGKAKCLRARLLSYFRPKSRDPKAGQIIAQ